MGMDALWQMGPVCHSSLWVWWSHRGIPHLFDLWQIQDHLMWTVPPRQIPNLQNCRTSWNFVWLSFCVLPVSYVSCSPSLSAPNNPSTGHGAPTRVHRMSMAGTGCNSSRAVWTLASPRHSVALPLWSSNSGGPTRRKTVWKDHQLPSTTCDQRLQGVCSRLGESGIKQHRTILKAGCYTMLWFAEKNPSRPQEFPCLPIGSNPLGDLQDGAQLLWGEAAAKEAGRKGARKETSSLCIFRFQLGLCL